MANIRSPLNKLTKLGRGQILFARFDPNGVASAGYFHLGNCESLQFTPKPVIEEVWNSMGGAATQYARGLSRFEAEVTVKGSEFSRENLALMYSGDANTFSQTGATATAESVTTTLVLGAYYQLAHRNITALTDLKVGATTLINNDTAPPGDYHVVDLVAGVVQILETPFTGAVITGATITADYTYGTISLDEVSPGTQGFVEGTLLFLPNNAKGINQEMRLHYCSFSPETGPEFVSDKFATWQAKGAVFNDYLATAGSHGGTAAYPVGWILNQTAT